MAKMRSRTEALVNAYLNNYQNANATTVSGGRSAQQSAQSRGSAIMNATDKTLPALKDYSADVLNGIIKSADNAQNTAISNFKLAKKQIEAEQKAAEKAAKAAAKSSGKSRSKKSSKKSSSTSSTDDASGSNTSLDSLFGGGASTDGTTGSTAGNKPKADDTEKPKTENEKAKEKSAQEKYLEAKKAGARTTAAKSYAERNGTGRVNAAQPAQSRAVTRGGKVIGSSYAAAGSAPSAAETQAAKNKRNDYKSRQEDIAAALKKLQSDADYRAELAAPGRKLTGAEIQAVKEYNLKPGDLYKQVQAGELSLDDYNKQGQELARMNQKADLYGLGQDMQAFTSGLMTSVPFLKQVDSAIKDYGNKATNGKYGEAIDNGVIPDTLQTLENYQEQNRIAAGAGTMAGKAAQYNLFNNLMEGTPLAETMGKVGGKVAGAASKVPVLGRFATPAAGEALGRILTDQTADTVLDTVPSLVNDLQTYDDQQSRIKNGEQVDNALTPGQIGLNTLGNVAQNFAFNAIPEVGGAVLNRLKGTAGDAAQDTLKQADDAAQDVQKSVPARNIVQPEANGTTGLAAQLQQMNTPDAANRSALDTLDKLRGQVNLNGAQEKEAEQLRRAVLQRQQEIGDEAKLALQNSDSLPIDAQAAKAYNEVNGGVVNDNLGAGVRADVPGIADSRASTELQPGNLGDGISGQAAEGGQNSTASVLGRGVQGNDAKSAAQVAEWAKSITGKGRQSVYTRRIENLYNQMQNGASREGMAEEAANIAAGLVKESDFAEPLDEATNALREYMKRTPIRLDEKAAGDILYTSGLKNIQQYNIQNGTKFSMTDGIPYDTAMQELGEMGVGVNGSSVDDLLKAVDASNATPLVDSDQAAAYSDYLRDRILDGPSDTQIGAEDFADWLDVQSFDRDAPDYVQRLLERDNIPALNQTAETVSEPVPGMGTANSARQVVKEQPLNGSESVPANAVGATSTRYSEYPKAVENKDYANQAAARIGLDDAHREGLTYSEHQVWTDREAQHQALDDINTYIQEAGGDVDKGLDNAMSALRKDTQWDKGESVTANNIRDRLRTEYMKTEPGTSEFYRQKARYDSWQSEISQQRSKTAQTMQSFTGDATARMHEVSSPIREKWESQHTVESSRIKKLSQELDKLKSEIAQRNLDDMNNTDYLRNAFTDGSNGKWPVPDNVKFPDSVRNAGDMDAEFGQMLKDNDIQTAEERIANFSDEDKKKYKQAAEDAYNDIIARVRKLCDKSRVKVDDDEVKTIAGKIMNGDNAESYYNSLISQAAGISDLSIDEMQLVDDLYSKAAKMGDSKARYDLESQAINIMAQHLPAKSWFERFDNIRYLAMLGNPTTHARNLIGNVLMKGLSDTKDEVAAVMQLAVTPKDARTKAVYVPQDMKNAASKWIDENAYTATLKDGGKYNLDQGLERARSTYGSTKGGRALQWLSDKNSALLDKEDEIFVKMGATHSLSNILTARGYDASIFTKTDEASQEVLQEALQLAIRDAQDVTFHANNALTKAFENVSHAGNKNGTIGEKVAYMIGNGILPFAKTPANILKTAAEYNLVGATAQAVYRGAKHQGSAAVTDALAKGVVGSAVMGIGWWLADQGFITGKLGDDKDYQEMLGNQEYSVDIPGMGSYTLDWASPSIVPLMMGANLAQGDYDLTDILDDPGKVAGQMGDVLAVALDPVTNTSMLSSLNDTFDNIRYNDEDALGAVGTLTTNALTSYAQQFVPTIAGKVARTIDSTRRSSYGGGDSATERNNSYLARSTLNKVPVLSQQNEAYIDQWGRETQNLDGTDDSASGVALRGLYNFASPGYYNAENVTPVDEYIQELYGNTNDKNVLPTKASNFLTVDNERTYMTPEEKTEYAKTSGQTAYDIIDSLRQNDMFLKLPEDQQSALVQEAYGVAKTAGGVAAVGDGVSGTESKEYEAYRDGGVDGLVGFMLMKNATDLVRDEKRETSGNDNADLDTVETWNTLYSQFGDDAVGNFVNSTSKGSTVRNISDLAGDKAVTAYMQAYSAVAKTLDDDQTPNKFTVGYGMQKYGLSGNDFAKAYLAAYYKKTKDGKYPDKGSSYVDKAGANIYQQYGADALQSWVNYRATIEDANGNGKVDKDEAVARLNEMSLTNELRRAYLTNTNKSWKNPY
jgi:hypothetical protein